MEKLQFADSDLGRLSSAIMRLVQYAESLAPFSTSSSPAARRQWSLWEHAYAAYNWRRQLVFHLSHVGPMFPPDNKAAALRGGIVQEEMNDEHWLQRELLVNRRIETHTHTKIARKQIAHLLRRRGVANPGRAVCEAARALAAKGILELTGGGTRRAQAGGWPSFPYRKRLWSEVEPNEAAVSHLARLRVSPDSLEG